MEWVTTSTMDARSDVYSLGVIAFELLTGGLPHDVRKLSIVEAARVIRDVTPDGPARRDPALRGDVNTIVRKMLEKEPARRYATAAAAAGDIRRFLAREPIRARPPSAWCQLSRLRSIPGDSGGLQRTRWTAESGEVAASCDESRAPSAS